MKNVWSGMSAVFWVILHAFLLSSADFFQNQFFRKNLPGNTLRVSNSFDPDQARHFVGPDLGLNCLQRLSADDTIRQRANPFLTHFQYSLILKVLTAKYKF